MEKICKTCSVSKPIEDFGNLKSSKDGKRRECKKCRNLRNVTDITREQSRMWRKNNPERVKSYRKKLTAESIVKYNENRRLVYATEESKEKRREYYEKTKEERRVKRTEYYRKNKHKQSEIWQRRYKKNPEYFKERAKINRVKFKDVLDQGRNRWYREQYQNNPLFRSWEQLSTNLRHRLKKNGMNTQDLIGYDKNTFITKVGYHKEGQELDHKIPVTWFKNFKPDLVYHWENLHYISSLDNRNKGARWAHPISLVFFQKIKNHLKDEFLNRFEIVFDNVVDTSFT